jgi:hypothetical protein
MKRAKKVRLEWIEKREWHVAVPASGGNSSADLSRAMEDACAQSGIFQRTGVVPESIKFSVEWMPEGN